MKKIFCSFCNVELPLTTERKKRLDWGKKDFYCNPTCYNRKFKGMVPRRTI